MARRLYVIEDDLMFAQRVRAAARRLGTDLSGLSPAEARGRTWTVDDVVVVQATLKPEQQQALIEDLTHRNPAPMVVAVTGHLETALRERLRAAGARLAAHSAMDRALARALELSAPDDHGVRGADPAPPRSPS
ncbi:MAG TPA: hypothetical protein VFR68_10555 [Candidatus Dormibacteraeota bacterium]|nr:hypothetical protein [Candidatus Dormibacteraeota bacterium]